MAHGHIWVDVCWKGGLDDLTHYETVSIRKFYFTFPSAILNLQKRFLEVLPSYLFFWAALPSDGVGKWKRNEKRWADMLALLLSLVSTGSLTRVGTACTLMRIPNPNLPGTSQLDGNPLPKTRPQTAPRSSPPASSSPSASSPRPAPLPHPPPPLESPNSGLRPRSSRSPASASGYQTRPYPPPLPRRPSTPAPSSCSRQGASRACTRCPRPSRQLQRAGCRGTGRGRVGPGGGRMSLWM